MAGSRVKALLVARGRARGLPADLDALVLASDLQGIVRAPGGAAQVLLGVAVAEVLAQLADDGAIPPAARTGVILAGDLYSMPDAAKRGGHGDVTAVWEAFADRCAWVAGVLGNHDDLGGDAGIAALHARGNVHVLDGDAIARGGVRFSSVGYIGGDPAKRGRRDPDDQRALIDLLIEAPVDVLILHEGPTGDDNQLGDPDIRAPDRTRSRAADNLWPLPLAAAARDPPGRANRQRRRARSRADARALIIRRSARA